MAQIISEEKNPSTAIIFQARDPYALELAGQKQIWQRILLTLSSGSHMIQSQEQDALSLCRAPDDELAKLLLGLERLLKGEQAGFAFEPSEPSFEFIFAKSRLQGYEIQVWLDSGNAETGFYTGDALGLRLHVTDSALAQFAKELKEEFVVLDKANL